MNWQIAWPTVKMVVLGIAEGISAMRVIPSIITLGYGLFCWHVWTWFSALPNPSVNQMGAFTAVFGIAGVVFGFYTRSANNVQWGRVDSMKQNITQKLFAARKLPPPEA